MKLTTILAAALLGGVAMPATLLADTMLGCEVRAVEGSNYVVKTDPTCNFAIITGRGAEIDRDVLEDLLTPVDDGDDEPEEPTDPEEPAEPTDPETDEA